MAKKKTNQNKKNPIGIIVGTLLIAALIGAAIYVVPKAKDAFDGAIDNVNNQIQDSMNNNAYSGKYNIGAITANGAPTSSKNCFYIKDHFECNGLTVTLSDKSELKYQIFYYDGAKNFLECTEVMNTDYAAEIPFYYSHARIMFITDVDYQLQLTDLSKYIEMFEVKTSDIQGVERFTEYKYDKGYQYGVLNNGIVEYDETIYEYEDGTTYHLNEYYTHSIDGKTIENGLIVNLKNEHVGEDYPVPFALYNLTEYGKPEVLYYFLSDYYILSRSIDYTVIYIPFTDVAKSIEFILHVPEEAIDSVEIYIY